jgi:hypothetical protein
LRRIKPHTPPLVFGPAVWHLNPIIICELLKQSRYVNYKIFFCKKGPKYKDKQIESYSHYNDPVDTSNGRAHGNSRRSGDASEEVQARVIDTLIEICLKYGLSKADAAYVLATAATESGFNPDAAAGTTSASGLGQFVKDTGIKYGLTTNAERFDIEKGGDALVVPAAASGLKPDSVAAVAKTYAASALLSPYFRHISIKVSITRA